MESMMAKNSINGIKYLRRTLNLLNTTIPTHKMEADINKFCVKEVGYTESKYNKQIETDKLKRSRMYVRLRFSKKNSVIVSEITKSTI